MVFITGDVADGSANDKLLRDLIGDNWKALTGAEQPVLQKTKTPSSPGYLHAEQWPALMKRVEAVRMKEKLEADSRAARSAPKLAPLLNTKVSQSAKVPVLAAPVMYDDEEDRQRTTYSSRAEFIKAKLDKHATMKELNYYNYQAVPLNPESDSMVISVVLVLLERFFYVVDDIWTFKKYLSHLVDVFLGPSTPPTKVFMRWALIVFGIFYAGENPRMRSFILLYIITFTLSFFLIHDLRFCKKEISEVVKKYAL